MMARSSRGSISGARPRNGAGLAVSWIVLSSASDAAGGTGSGAPR